MAKAKLLLVDGHSFAYRAFYAIQRLSNSKGQPTNAVFGFAKMVRKLLQDLKPTHGAIVMDLGEPVQRMQKLKTYKSHRKPMPDDLRTQIPWICEFAESSRIPVIQKEGIEADDIIATLALQATEERMHVAIATSDKDFMQIVTDSVFLLNPAARETGCVDVAGVRERFQVDPGQMVDFLSLRGDSVDNIPGVPGVGEKTAAGLLQQFGSVETLYRHLDEVRDERLRQKLRDHQAQVALNRELVQLDTAVPLEIRASGLGLTRPDFPRLIAFCERLEFRGLGEEIRRESQQDANPGFSFDA